MRAKIARNNGRTTTIHLFSLQWARLLALFGKRHEKHLPRRFLCGSPSYLQGLFDGLVASDGHIAKDGRMSLRNTSLRLVELFNVLCYLLQGSFPECVTESPSAGGLLGTSDDRCRPSFRSRLAVRHERRHLAEYQVVKRLSTSGPVGSVSVYDIEVDCPDAQLHRRQRDRAQLHLHHPWSSPGSACRRSPPSSTAPRLHASTVCPSWPTAASVLRRFVKALAAGADTVMLGTLLAGADEAPASVFTRASASKSTAAWAPWAP